MPVQVLRTSTGAGILGPEATSIQISFSPGSQSGLCKFSQLIPLSQGSCDASLHGSCFRSGTVLTVAASKAMSPPDCGAWTAAAGHTLQNHAGSGSLWTHHATVPQRPQPWNGAQPVTSEDGCRHQDGYVATVTTCPSDTTGRPCVTALCRLLWVFKHKLKVSGNLAPCLLVASLQQHF